MNKEKSEFYNYVKEHSIDAYNKKHLKGYIYDSLMYRYIRAREQMAEYEYLRDKQNNVEWTVYKQRANRDIARFAEILSEVMGSHD